MSPLNVNKNAKNSVKNL